MKHKIWQFRLRSLFALLFLSALTASWWSHRSHCLERAEFHKAQAQSYAMDSQNAEFEAKRVSILNQFRFNRKEMREQRVYEMKLREYELNLPENKEQLQNVVNEVFLSRQGKSSGLDFFDESVSERQRVAGAISAGYLLAPVNGEPVPQSVDLPPPPTLRPRPRDSIAKTQAPKPPSPAPPAIATLVPSLEQVALEKRATTLQVRSKFHIQWQERFLRAIYRPWMNLREPDPPTVTAGPKG